MTGDEIRKRFIEFFQKHDHNHQPSASLIPHNDPSLLFTNAGMAQFKDFFLGHEKPLAPRIVTAQKCVRAGGKHNDLENVGHTSRHHTFFEMLGNFSFGDYFKAEAIPLAWMFVTETLGLPAEKLVVTVYAEDDEAYDIWRDKVGLPEEKIIRIATSDNFWAMGDTGPCGPCSEIFYDHGDHIPGGPPGSEDEDGDRFVEIWNLVFMQYNRDSDGEMTPLPKPCIDTGAGLERIAAILQGETNNFNTDLFQPIIQAAARICGCRYGEDVKTDTSLRVIADHIRSCGFLLADGVMPSNEGRGYVLRRIMRRAMRHGRMLGLEAPFMFKLLSTLASCMGETYPELHERQSTMVLVMETEEKRFAKTLGSGLKILEEALRSLKEGDLLDGKTVFTLYDTYGFPVDLTADITRDRGISLDTEGFETHMLEQKARARAAWSGSGDQGVEKIYHALKEQVGVVEFLGYTTEKATADLKAILVDGASVEKLSEGEEGVLIVNQTPFYGEAGGQVGDQGEISTLEGSRFTVTDTQKPLSDFTTHHGRVDQGTLQVGDSLTLKVDSEQRISTRRHHSATHYLHYALRSVLGDHVQQGGSLVSQERLRFDFSHFQAMTAAELEQIEEIVNRGILANDSQETTVMTPEEAVEAGAMALFGEKYGTEVRVVRIGPTLELCGGTHVSRSGDIGLFRVVSESAVSAGMRRIEAVCGPQARASYQKESQMLQNLARRLKTPPNQLEQNLEKLLQRQKELEKALEKSRAQAAGDQIDHLVKKAVKIQDLSLLAEKITDVNSKELRGLVDRLKDKLGSSVIFLGVPGSGKVSLIAGVSKDLTKKVKAGDLIRFVAEQVGGRGGGRPDMAQGGGSQPENLSQALGSIPGWIKEKLS
ncbi:alanine--tRNA ligase [Magnetococcales bacterium HHB-1]